MSRFTPWPHALPHALTSFIGREQEIVEARWLLQETRLLTLTGTGGVGKTRLGQEVARGLAVAFPDGAWLVELAPLTDALLVPKAVAYARGVREEPGRRLMETLVAALRVDRLLLVLDNCEHLIDACAEVADTLLRSCPKLRILATSRQPLGISGEAVFRVPSLTLSPRPPTPTLLTRPDHRARSRVDRQAETTGRADAPVVSEAVRLFADRARAASSDFALTDRNIVTIETICRRLDGIPLAIELAAARIAVLSPEQISERLDTRFRLLSQGSSTVLPRYRTLRALIDWSHDLLTEHERMLLRRLAVFADGWTLEAAEGVCAGDGIEQGEVLDLLSALVAKSLVQPADHADEIRFRFLESLRAYASEKLREADEEATLRERHSDWFAALAVRAEPELIGPNQETWLDRLDRDRANLRAAQRSASARGDSEMLAQMGAALWQFWWARADATEARELIDEIVPLVDQVTPTRALALALHGGGILAGTFADYATCRSLLEVGLSVARQLDDPRTLAKLLDSLGRQLFIEGLYDEARVQLHEGLAIYRAIDDRHGLSRALSHAGFLDYLEGRQESARAIYQEGLDLARASGDGGAVAEFLDNLGRTSIANGDLDGAAREFQAALAIWRETGQNPWLSMGLNNLGIVCVLRGEYRAAAAHLAEALDLAHTMGNRRREAFILSAIATLAGAAGYAERAVRLDAAAFAAIADLGAVLAKPMHATCAPFIGRSRMVLGEARAESATVAGAALTLPRAVEEARIWLAETPFSDALVRRPARQEAPPPVHAPRVLRAAPGRSGAVGLSPRELEVAALVARGMTNRQIAEALVITEGTAANHVKHILARLVLDSRVQIAAWFVERGLHRASSA